MAKYQVNTFLRVKAGQHNSPEAPMKMPSLKKCMPEFHMLEKLLLQNPESGLNGWEVHAFTILEHLSCRDTFCKLSDTGILEYKFVQVLQTKVYRLRSLCHPVLTSNRQNPAGLYRLVSFAGTTMVVVSSSITGRYPQEKRARAGRILIFYPSRIRCSDRRAWT